METTTAQQILDVAHEILRNRGYSAFSYADISERVGIRKASIHYHFPAKEDLVRTLVQQYRVQMARSCDRISQSPTNPHDRLMAFAELYRVGLENQQICLCGMLAADFAVLPASIQAEIRSFFGETEVWLTTLLQDGCDANAWHCSTSPTQEAKGLIAMLQGAQLLARSAVDSVTAFEQVVFPLLQAKLLSS